LSRQEALSPAFWAVQPTAPVLFWPTLDAVLHGGDRVLVEAGPAQSLSALARGHAAVRSGRSEVVPTLPPRAMGPGADRESVRAARERLTARPSAAPSGTAAAAVSGHSGRLPVDRPAR
jgi:acyl transferase domain-containing protein